MGNLTDKPGVERLFDGKSPIIDLRQFTTTNVVSNVFFHEINKVRYLFIFYLGDYWCLGSVLGEFILDNYNPNHSILLMFSGRKYIIHKFLPYYILNASYKIVEEHILNKSYYPIT